MISTLFYPPKPNNIFCHTACVDTTTQGSNSHRDQLWLQSDNDL